MQRITPNTNSSALSAHLANEILAKIQTLPVQYAQEVGLFVEFLKRRHEENAHNLTDGYFQLSAEAWDDE